MQVSSLGKVSRGGQVQGGQTLAPGQQRLEAGHEIAQLAAPAALAIFPRQARLHAVDVASGSVGIGSPPIVTGPLERRACRPIVFQIQQKLAGGQQGLLLNRRQLRAGNAIAKQGGGLTLGRLDFFSHGYAFCHRQGRQRRAHGADQIVDLRQGQPGHARFQHHRVQRRPFAVERQHANQRGQGAGSGCACFGGRLEP